MQKNFQFTRVVLYQNLGFLVIIGLCYLDDLLKLSTWIFYRNPVVFEFRRSMLGMLLILAVWFVVSRSTRRVLNRLHYLEKFLHVCAWCRRIDYHGRWMPLEEFMKQNFDTSTTHGICPDCMDKQKPVPDAGN